MQPAGGGTKFHADEHRPWLDGEICPTSPLSDLHRLGPGFHLRGTRLALYSSIPSDVGAGTREWDPASGWVCYQSCSAVEVDWQQDDSVDTRADFSDLVAGLRAAGKKLVEAVEALLTVVVGLVILMCGLWAIVAVIHWMWKQS